VRTKQAASRLCSSSSPHRAGRGDASVGCLRGRCPRSIPSPCSQAGAIAEGLSRVRPFRPCPRRAPSSDQQRSPAVNSGNCLWPLTLPLPDTEQADSASQARGGPSSLVRAGSARRREPLVLGGHERSTSVNQHRRQRRFTAMTLDGEAARRWVRISPDGGRVCTLAMRLMSPSTSLADRLSCSALREYWSICCIDL
jgi:hypothetical protein